MIGFIGRLIQHVTIQFSVTLTHIHTHTHTSVLSHVITAFVSSGYQWLTFPFLWVLELPRPQLPAPHCNSSYRLNGSSPLTNSLKSQNFVTTDGQSASLSWCQATIWDPRPDFYCCKTVAYMLMWGALCLLFKIAAGSRQRI
jgi:hypothetical protein